MNKQNFENQDRFPLSTQALTFMQDMIYASAQLALIGGNNYILSGCQASGNNVAPGTIVINGEIIPFEGGVISSTKTITIIETPEQISANGLTFPDARVTRKAKFASGSGPNYYPWADFAPLSTNTQLEKAKATVKYVDDEIAKLGGVPAGVIVMWSGSVSEIPKGWQLCNGGPIGNTGKYTPDLSGRFIVGYSAEKSLGYTEIKEGSRNKDQYNMTLKPEHMPSHNHNVRDYFMIEHESVPAPGGADFGKENIGGNNRGNTGKDTDNNTLFYRNHLTDSTGKGEEFDLRPPYYVLAFIIKINTVN